MPTIFISYRREDSAGHAGRLFDRLREHFGRDRVFLDVVGIDAGVDFVDTIDQAVGSCDVLLAVIGREWLTCCDKQQRRRLDDPNDFIRAEISSALKRKVRVVPVLVEGAEMPPTDALPEDLKPLTRRQAVELRDSRWHDDIEALIAALERDSARTGAGVTRPAPPPPAPSGPVEPEAARKPDRKALLWGIGALAALLIAAGAIVSFWPEKEPPPDGGSLVNGTTPAPEETTGTPSRDDSSPEPVSETPATPEPEETATPSRDDQTPEPEVRTVQAPNLVGLSLQAAIDQLRAAGLVVGDQEARQTAQAPARQVLSQWPSPGKELDKGSSVDLVYAEPPPDSRIVVPDVIGKDVREATAILQKAGLRLTRLKEASKEAQHTVLRQEPLAGTRVEKGTQVTFFYAVPIEEPPPAGRTNVHIWYSDEAEQATAADLAKVLRDLFPEANLRISLSRPGRLEAGKIYYASRSRQAQLASDIARKSGEILSRAAGREVIIQMKLDPRVAGDGLILTMPKL